MNAFALPGGKRSPCIPEFFPVAQDGNAGLAAVMGHEVVHALARHGGERMSQIRWRRRLYGRSHRAQGQQRQSVLAGGDGGLGCRRAGRRVTPVQPGTVGKQTMLGVLLAADADMTPRAINCGRMGGSFPAENPRRVYVHTRVTKPGFNSLRWMGEAMPIYQSKPPAPTGCRRFIESRRGTAESLLTGPYTFSRALGGHGCSLVERARREESPDSKGQGRWITSRRSDPTPAPQKTNRRWPV